MTKKNWLKKRDRIENGFKPILKKLDKYIK